MRFRALMLALLLSGCTAADDNAALNDAANVSGNAESNAADPPQNQAGADGAADEAAPPPGSPSAQPPPGAPGEQPSGAVSLSAAPARVAPGAMMTLTLRNGSRGQIGYNLCTSAIETAAGRTVRTDRMCTMELRTLGPDRSADYAYELPARIERGSYRFSTGVERMDAGARSVVRSNSFEVR